MRKTYFHANEKYLAALIAVVVIAAGAFLCLRSPGQQLKLTKEALNEAEERPVVIELS